ncbi:MAG: hypothetical protein NDI61_01075 [Bdellovibrionaceae bacterium]|nr:hypothetical protein [Pseudobdellovibrionaceae bacterium]
MKTQTLVLLTAVFTLGLSTHWPELALAAQRKAVSGKAKPKTKVKAVAPRHARTNIASTANAVDIETKLRTTPECDLEICFVNYTEEGVATPFAHNSEFKLPDITDPLLGRIEDPRALRACRLDGSDRYYEKDLELPRLPVSPTAQAAALADLETCLTCSLRSRSQNVMGVLAQLTQKLSVLNPLANARLKEIFHPDMGESQLVTQNMPFQKIRRECIARSLQRGHSYRSSNNFSTCASPESTPQNGNRRQGRPEAQPHCPTPKLVNFLYEWSNAALKCMDPTGSQNASKEHLTLDSEFVFALINHESGWNMNATSHIGNGFMQLTTSPVKDFTNPNWGISQYWDAVRDKPECAPFKAQVDTYTRFKSTTWKCSVTHPDAIGVHMIIGLSNLNSCQTLAYRELVSSRVASRIASIRKDPNSPLAHADRKRVFYDLVAVCHNWGIGNMQTAFRRTKGMSFQGAEDFRAALQTEGWNASGKDGVRTFADKVDNDLEMIKKENPTIRHKGIDSCVE